MKNGNIMTFFEAYPEHKRLDAVRFLPSVTFSLLTSPSKILEIAEGLNYLHGLDPQIVHADIRGVSFNVVL